jgi:hypothetical protein
MLVKHPGLTLVAALSLAIGIGATTTVFGLLNAMLLRPLPVRDAASLVSVNKPGSNGSTIHTISHPDYVDYRARATVFSDIVAWTEVPASVELKGQVEQAYGMLASGNYFPVLGVRPALADCSLPMRIAPRASIQSWFSALRSGKAASPATRPSLARVSH